MKLFAIDLFVNPAEKIFSSADCQSVLKAYPAYYHNVIGFHPPWIGYWVFRDEQIVGCCGYTGKPSVGKVEIAYGTFKEFEGQGIASFSCRELTKLAFETDSTLIVTAKTAPESNASVKILKRNGFEFSGIVQDDEIGDAWEWQKQCLVFPMVKKS
jgi:ribosomal-protein-alanine N-acetyltransferase